VEVETYLKGIDFPADKQQLINHAKKNNANEDVISLLKTMPFRYVSTSTAETL
jgi:hypothetical protein